MGFPLFGCSYSGIVNDYFDNVHPSGQPMVERAEIRDVESEVLLEKLELFTDPRKNILRNVLNYTNSLENSLVRLIGEYHHPRQFFRPNLGNQFEMPDPTETVHVRERYSFEGMIPSDRRFILWLLPFRHGLRIRFPYVDSQTESEDYRIESKFTIQNKGDDLGVTPVIYDQEQVLRDRDLLFSFWFSGDTNQYLEGSKYQLVSDG